MLHEADYKLNDVTEKTPKKSSQKPAVLIADDPTHPKHEQATVIKIIGQRMREARELCNMSQVMAARRLGYSNPSKLSKIESASDTNSVPLWVIARAAALYEVSVDFLFGLSSDWEASARATQERRVSAWLLGEFTRQQEVGMAVIRSLNDQVERLAALLPGLHAGALEVNRRLARCRELNPAGYQDLRGGSSLEGAVDELLDRAHQANEAYQRFAGHLRLMERSQGDLREVAHG